MNKPGTPATDRRPGLRAVGERTLTLITVGAILLAAAVLRFTNLNWDQAQWIHPDEGHMRAITGVIHWPASLNTYFDTHGSPLNPRNHDQVYSYGTLPLFATRGIAEWLDRACGAQAAPLPTRVATPLLQRLGHVLPNAPSGWHCNPGTFTWTYSAFVGRHLAAISDMGTVILIGILGGCLYNRHTGLIAMALAATTAFMIQQAHFYTVDSIATFFTMLTAVFAVKAGQASPQRAPWLALAGAGLSSGLAAACKVSAALAVGLAALGAGAWVRRAQGDSPNSELPLSILRASGPLALAAVLSIVGFRVAQPYAFEGPGVFDLQPNAAWFDRLDQIRDEQAGSLDLPSGRQWANRLPLIFPLMNLTIWGMGLPLGLTAALGWGMTGWRLYHGDRRHMVIWVWTTAYVAFYATRWVKAMRYFLPIYPLLILMAAFAAEKLLTTSSARPAPTNAPLSHEPGLSALPDQPPRPRWRGYAAIAILLSGTALWGAGLTQIYARPHTRIAASRWIYANVPDGSVVANEHWDWGLPLRIDGRDPFRVDGAGPTYSQITLELYNEDTPAKREQLLTWLEDADYIFLASNRLYGSISRLPERYPLTSLYYRKLFAGELGFELAARVTSYIRIGPFSFPDQENPFPLMQPGFATQGEPLPIPLPPAEESFSVYDHPDCLIFRKTAAYSRESVAQILGAVDLSDAAAWQTPHEATPEAIHLAHTALFYIGLAITAIVGGVGLLRSDA